MFGQRELSSHVMKGKADHQERIASTMDTALTNLDPMETMNINGGYLLALIRLVDEYTIIELNKDTYNDVKYLQSLMRIVRSMTRLLSCKMNVEKKTLFKKRINDVINMIQTVVVGGKDNHYIDPQKSFETETILGEIFEDLLDDMERRGLLTYRAENPMNAMGKFSD